MYDVCMELRHNSMKNLPELCATGSFSDPPPSHLPPRFGSFEEALLLIKPRAERARHNMYFPSEIFELIISYCRPYYWLCRKCANPRLELVAYCRCRFLDDRGLELTHYLAVTQETNWRLNNASLRYSGHPWNL